MTENKPIIIDEVDVSGCEFYNTDDKTCREVNGKYDTDLFICEFDKCENSNCYFKQLDRKTQECEELKKKINYIRDKNIRIKESATDEQLDFLALNNYIKTLELQIDQLKAENEEWQKEYWKLEKGNDFLAEKNSKLRAEKGSLQKSQFCVAYEKDCYKVCKQQNCIIKNGYKSEQKLEKIEKIVKDFHYAIIPFHRGINHEMADRIDYYLNQMLQIIDEVE